MAGGAWVALAKAGEELSLKSQGRVQSSRQSTACALDLPLVTLSILASCELGRNGHGGGSGGLATPRATENSAPDSGS